MKTFYDLNVKNVETLESLHKLGWHGACLIYDKGKPKVKDLDLLTAAEISSNIRKNARKALELVDMVFASDNVREASECWEVDAIYSSKDIDNVVAKFMSERDIALMINFSELLNARSKSKVIRRMAKNVKLARKHKLQVIMSSGATTQFGARSPLDLASVGVLLGLPANEVARTVSANPLELVKKARDRKDPDVIMKGLRVVSWGDQRPQPKKQWGWY